MRTITLTDVEHLTLFAHVAADVHEAEQHVKQIESLPAVHDLLPGAKARAEMLRALYEKLIKA